MTIYRLSLSVCLFFSLAVGPIADSSTGLFHAHKSLLTQYTQLCHKSHLRDKLKSATFEGVRPFNQSLSTETLVLSPTPSVHIETEKMEAKSPTSTPPIRPKSPITEESASSQGQVVQKPAESIRAPDADLHTSGLPPLDDAANGGIEQHPLPTFNEYHAMVSEGSQPKAIVTKGSDDNTAHRGTRLGATNGVPSGSLDNKNTPSASSQSSTSTNQPNGNGEGSNQSSFLDPTNPLPDTPSTPMPNVQTQTEMEDGEKERFDSGSTPSVNSNPSNGMDREGTVRNPLSDTPIAPSIHLPPSPNGGQHQTGTNHGLPSDVPVSQMQHHAPPPTVSTVKPTTAGVIHLRRNVAAVACGAKLLDSSPGVKNAEAIMNGNNDEYLNAPCSADKWFVIEVCEPVQLRTIELANFELFSSRVKSFRVSISERFPAKTWTIVGVFTALDTKGLQTFDVHSDKLIKYAKFEMLDHYGTQHYCPLTMVRLFGVLSDDLDDEELEEADAAAAAAAAAAVVDMNSHRLGALDDHPTFGLNGPPPPPTQELPVDHVTEETEQMFAGLGSTNTDGVPIPGTLPLGVNSEQQLVENMAAMPSESQFGTSTETNPSSPHETSSSAQTTPLVTERSLHLGSTGDVLDHGGADQRHSSPEDEMRPLAVGGKKMGDSHLMNAENSRPMEAPSRSSQIGSTHVQSPSGARTLGDSVASHPELASPQRPASVTTKPSSPQVTSSQPIHANQPSNTRLPTSTSDAENAEPGVLDRVKAFFWNAVTSSVSVVMPSGSASVTEVYNLSRIGLCPHHLLAVDSLFAYGFLNHSTIPPVISLDSIQSVRMSLPIQTQQGSTALTHCLWTLDSLVHTEQTQLNPHSPVSVQHRMLHLQSPQNTSCTQACQLLNLSFVNTNCATDTDPVQSPTSASPPFSVMQLLVAYRYRRQMLRDLTEQSGRPLLPWSGSSATGGGGIDEQACAAMMHRWMIGADEKLVIPSVNGKMCPKLPDFLLIPRKIATPVHDSIHHPATETAATTSPHYTTPEGLNSGIHRGPIEQSALRRDATIVVPATQSGSRKDTTTLMRLNNRVRLLERNVSVSMRYLEELSQSYRRQMERLSRSFNLTTAWLKATAQGAEERDQQQQARITDLEVQLTVLLAGLNPNGTTAPPTTRPDSTMTGASSLPSASTPPLPSFDASTDWTVTAVSYGPWLPPLEDDWIDDGGAVVEDEDDEEDDEEDSMTHTFTATPSSRPPSTFPSSSPYSHKDNRRYSASDQMHSKEKISTTKWIDWLVRNFGAAFYSNLLIDSLEAPSHWIQRLMSMNSGIVEMFSLAIAHLLFAVFAHTLVYLTWLRPKSRCLLQDFSSIASMHMSNYHCLPIGGGGGGGIGGGGGSHGLSFSSCQTHFTLKHSSHPNLVDGSIQCERKQSAMSPNVNDRGVKGTCTKTKSTPTKSTPTKLQSMVVENHLLPSTLNGETVLHPRLSETCVLQPPDSSSQSQNHSTKEHNPSRPSDCTISPDPLQDRNRRPIGPSPLTYQSLTCVPITLESQSSSSSSTSQSSGPSIAPTIVASSQSVPHGSSDSTITTTGDGVSRPLSKNGRRRRRRNRPERECFTH